MPRFVAAGPRSLQDTDSEIALGHFARDVVGLSQRQRDDGQRWVLRRTGGETLPSETNKFFTSCVCPHLLTTPSPGFSLIRLVPRLWVDGYGGVG